MIRKKLLFTVSVLFIVLIPAAIVAEALDMTVLEPYHTLRYFDSNELYVKAAAGVKRSIVEQAENERNPLIRKVASGIMEKAADQTVTPQWIRVKAELGQVSLWDYLLGKTDHPEPIPVGELRQSVNEVVKQELNRLPTEIWLVPGMNKDKWAASLAAHIPDQAALEDVFSNPGQLQRVKKAYQSFESARRGLIAILILALVIGLFTGSFRRTWRWFGVSFIVSGLLTLFMAVCFAYAEKWLSKLHLSGSLADYRDELANAAAIAADQLGQMTGGMGLAVLILGLLGVWLGKPPNQSHRQKNRGPAEEHSGITVPQRKE